jgi:hypothetical protein
MILSQDAASASLNAQVSNLGADAQYIIYDGTVPAGPDTALSGNTALVTGQVSGSTWSAPTYSAALSGMASTATMSASGYSPAASGVASFARLVTSGGVAKEQLTVGTSGADVIMGNTTVQTGVPVQMGITLAMPSQSV